MLTAFRNDGRCAKLAKGKLSNIYAEEIALANAALVLSQALAEAGITQAQLARRLGVSRAFVSLVLSADKGASLRTLARFAAALGKRVVITLEPLGKPEL